MLEEGETGAVPCVGKSLLGGRIVHSSLQQNQSRKETRAGGQLCSLLQHLSNDLAPEAREALQGAGLSKVIVFGVCYEKNGVTDEVGEDHPSSRKEKRVPGRSLQYPDGTFVLRWTEMGNDDLTLYRETLSSTLHMCGLGCLIVTCQGF